MKFVILLEKIASPEDFQAAVPDHVAYMDELHRRGALIAAGPFQDGRGGMVVIEVEDEPAAGAIAEADPFITRGPERLIIRPIRSQAQSLRIRVVTAKPLARRQAGKMSFLAGFRKVLCRADRYGD